MLDITRLCPVVCGNCNSKKMQLLGFLQDQSLLLLCSSCGEIFALPKDSPTFSNKEEEKIPAMLQQERKEDHKLRINLLNKMVGNG